MKKLIVAASLLALAGQSAPLMAHPGHHAHRHPHGAAGWTPIRAEVVRDGIEALEADINRADTNDTISEREAADLRSRRRDVRNSMNLR